MKNKCSEPNAGAQCRLFNERFQISKILPYKNTDSKSEFFVSLFHIRKKYENNKFLKFTYVYDIHLIWKLKRWFFNKKNERFQILNILKYKNLDSKSEFFGWILIFIFIFFSVCLLYHSIQQIKNKNEYPKWKTNAEPNTGAQRRLFNERFQKFYHIKIQIQNLNFLLVCFIISEKNMRTTSF